MSASHDCGADAAAYALGALEPDEAESFRQHLHSCVVCQDEVDSFQRLSHELPLAAPQFKVPKDLRSRVLADVREDARTRERSRRTQKQGSKGFGGFRFSLPAPALGGAFALVLAVMAFAVVQLSSNRSSSPLIVQASVGDAQVRMSDYHGELIVHKLKQPEQGKIYEVWLKRAHGAPQPTKALFSVTSKGDGDVDIPGSVKGVKQVLVTQQPADQTQTPVGKPLIVATLS